MGHCEKKAPPVPCDTVYLTKVRNALSAAAFHAFLSTREKYLDVTLRVNNTNNMFCLLPTQTRGNDTDIASFLF